MTEANNIAQAEVQVIAQATALGHVLEGFVVRQFRPETSEPTWKRSVCVNCGMLWDVRWAPDNRGIHWDVRWAPETGLLWGVAKLEQPNRKRSQFDEDGDEPEPVTMTFHALPPRCEDARTAGYGIWLFALDFAV